MDRKRVLITGASGMLGATLAALFRDGWDVYATGTRDFPGNPAPRFLPFDLRGGDYAGLAAWARPDIVVHSAAMTNVDACERDPEQAFAVNSESARKLLQAAPAARVLLISSDAVFADGRHMATEADEAVPATVYGRSKVLAERYLAEAGRGHCAIRTTIVGRNLNPAKQGFAEWIVNSLAAEKPVNLFGDVLFTPINIWDFAAELEWIMRGGEIGPVIHLSGTEAATKHAFGLALCRSLGLDESLVRESSIDGMGFAAKRSKDQSISSARYEAVSNRSLPDLRRTVDGLAAQFKEVPHARNQDRQ